MTQRYLAAITEAANAHFISDRSSIHLEALVDIIAFIYGKDENDVKGEILHLVDGFGDPDNYEVKTFQVVNGFIAEGERAVTCDGTQLDDGWYALRDGDADPIITEPADSAQAAELALRAFTGEGGAS